ncbi:MAG TPA: class I SAM-dependent methyltransferase [Mycobacterium sp.]|nr:class I SAM-dependent methyltransferase [Mycobacterium sp.]HTX95952.1 class I SAM-dependent methyltransferase [Mycobacterium sp.]
MAADSRPGVRPVPLAGRDRRHAPPAKYPPGRGPLARRRDRRRDRAEHRALSRRDRRRLTRRLQRHARVARIIDASAELLPLADASVDTVVSTLVLCTVDHPERALREIARVLRPDGQLLFIEHACASSQFLAACQDRLLQPWRRFAGGCRCNRPTVELMRACGFVVTADDLVWRGMPPIVRPLVVGRATR